jgi:hypothetical protein
LNSGRRSGPSLILLRNRSGDECGKHEH